MAKRRIINPVKEGAVYMTDLQLAKRYDVSRPTIWRWLKNGLLPKPHKLNGSTRWMITEIEKFDKSLKPAQEAEKRIKKNKAVEKPDKKISDKEKTKHGTTINFLENNLRHWEEALKVNLKKRDDLKQSLLTVEKQILDQREKVKSFKDSVNFLKLENIK